MELILWRHADAEEGMPDEARALTPKGDKQARRMAQWLNERLPNDALILASPAVRAQQTAAALEREVLTVSELGVGATVAQVFKAASWPRASRVTVVVGHQPVLGEAAALLLAGLDAPVSVKKGSVWWFTSHERQGRVQAVLRAVMTPEMC